MNSRHNTTRKRFILTIIIIISSIYPSTSSSQQASNKKKDSIKSEADTKNKDRTDAIARLDLEHSLAIAINNNFELKAIRSRRLLYDLAITERFRDYFPTLTLSYLQTEESRKREADTRQHRFSADTNILLYDGGRRSLSYDIAKLNAIISRNDYRIALNTLITEIRNSYFEILQLRDSLAIHEKTLERGLAQLRFIAKERELGEATRFDVMEIETKVMEIELNLEKAIDRYTISINRFKLLLKIDWRQPLEVIGDIERDFLISPIDDKFNTDLLVSIAMRNRKEIGSSDIEYAITKKTYLINKLYYFPQFSFGLSYSLSDDGFIPREKGWGINLQVTTAIWGSTGTLSTGYSEDDNANSRAISNSGSVAVLNDLSYKRNLVESTIELKRTREKEKDIRQQIANEVLSSHSALINSWKMIGIAKKQLELYDAQLEIERLRASMGESRRYDLMKKEIERGEAAIAYLESLVRYLVSASTLETSIGVAIGFLKLSHMKSR
jgi:outer membrane protein TolC